jgi:hypothetical protein
MVNEEKAQAIYFSHWIRPCESLLALNGWNILYVNHLGVIFDKKITWRQHTKTIEAKTFTALIRTYSLFKSGRLSPNIKLNIHNHQIWNDLCLSCPGNCGRYPSTENAVPIKQGSPNNWQFYKVYTGLQIAQGFQYSVHLWLYNKIIQATCRNHTKSWKC